MSIIDLAVALKHLPGKHPQKRHGGGDNGVVPSMNSLGRDTSPAKPSYTLSALRSQLEGAIGEVQSEGTKMGLRDANSILGIAKDVGDATKRLQELSAKAEVVAATLPVGYLDGLDMAKGIVETGASVKKGA